VYVVQKQSKVLEGQLQQSLGLRRLVLTRNAFSATSPYLQLIEQGLIDKEKGPEVQVPPPPEMEEESQMPENPPVIIKVKSHSRERLKVKLSRNKTIER
jgi:hypothetical protein